ncbi:alpha/beta hydrolase family protein [Streptomyces sp. LX-29]|uniref:alpha/beta hydrolase n=1 Tax=Streptomyces sp. LX-29 TaxID=2900152 RepID=UPI00240DC895|nr:alpha/beta hydrolase [Streptomyces sp. LX-29]WFB09760.1 alpha/beta hydrolase family protein [Streptomyces sp. LX-29]
MTSLPELDSPSPGTTAWRALLALAVVFVLLATTGWTAIRHQQSSDPRAVALAAWQQGTIDGRPLPDPHARPRPLGRFFDSLTAAQRHHLARRYPLVVGNLNGAPVGLRYEANRYALATARDVERRRMRDDRLTPLGRAEAGRRMHRYESLLRRDRQILAFDPAGPGRVAEVFGDLARAEHVAIVVPGVDTNALTFERTERVYRAPVGMARALYRAERSLEPDGENAVIAWADYTAPVGTGLDAATGKLAAEGALRLRALANALPARSRTTLVCHSYGSVVCGVAARDLSPNVTDIAVAGSPGMRAEHASDLGSAARVWAMRDADDWIEDVPNLEVGGLGHGADPVSPGFGARVLSAERAEGHSGYFVPGTDSLLNFAKVSIGRLASVSCADGDDCAVGRT